VGKEIKYDAFLFITKQGVSVSNPAIHSLNPKETAQLLEQNPRALFIDVRSSMEFLFVGHPKGAINIPWIDEPDWTINPDFAKDIRKLALGGICENELAEAIPVILICRSGVRSLDAGKCLLDAGFHNIYNVLEGFEGALDAHHHRSTVGGWRFHGLPWEQC
jgi:rhodanese-related sulfurtransferase